MTFQWTAVKLQPQELRRGGENQMIKILKAQESISSTLGCFREKMEHFYFLFLTLLIIASEITSEPFVVVVVVFKEFYYIVLA